MTNKPCCKPTTSCNCPKQTAVEFVGTKVMAEKWGCAQATISRWCREKLIQGAEQDGKGSPWRIPANAEKPRK